LLKKAVSDAGALLGWSEIGRRERFRSARALVNYTGLAERHGGRI
jgi:hypothetical protein